MINVFENTPAEKEEYVLDMLQSGYSYSQIMKECHVSPATISSVKKKYFGTTDDSILNSNKTSKESQAFHLFEQGKSIIDVKIEVDIESSDVLEYHKKYLELRSRSDFNTVYDSVKGNISPFLELFNLMNGLGMTPQQVQEQVKYGYELPNLQTIHSGMKSQIQDMAIGHSYLDSQINTAAKELQQHKNFGQFFDFQNVQKRKEIERLDSTINRKKRIIRRLDNSE